MSEHYPFYCKEDWTQPACPECGAVDCDKSHNLSAKCSSGSAPGMRKVCDRCGRMECPSIQAEFDAMRAEIMAKIKNSNQPRHDLPAVENIDETTQEKIISPK
jgi:hypothetical protein